jgi:hypothetical protein
VANDELNCIPAPSGDTLAGQIGTLFRDLTRRFQFEPSAWHIPLSAIEPLVRVRRVVPGAKRSGRPWMP